MNVIQVENLKKSYQHSGGVFRGNRGIFEAIKGISFKVAENEIFGILGPNGAGKTTTLEILEGVQTANGGRASILGLNVFEQKEKVKGLIGVQLQTSEYFPSLTLKELLDLFGSFYGIRPDSGQLLAKVGLGEKADQPVKNLSGGQKQRFTLASALVNDPKVIFLDEPTTGLDPKARREIWELIRMINSSGKTIVLTTHNMEEAEYLCHRVAILDEGRILTISEPRKLIEKISQTSQVSFFSRDPIDESWWRSIQDVEKVYSMRPKVILEIKSLQCVIDIIRLLQEHKVAFSGFTVKTATLEDVYLDLTGKEFEP